MAIKVAVISIEENYLIVDRGFTTYVGKLGRGFKTAVSIHITRWCVMNFPVQWNVEVKMLRVLFGFVQNDGWPEEFPIGLVKDK